jgi:hypothetical protein
MSYPMLSPGSRGRSSRACCDNLGVMSNTSWAIAYPIIRGIVNCVELLTPLSRYWIAGTSVRQEADQGRYENWSATLFNKVLI